MEIIEFINEYWQVLTGLIALVVLWGKLNATTNEQERRIAYLETKTDEMNPILLDIRERLVSIETTLKLHIHDDEKR
jgi:hypothetical protein